MTALTLIGLYFGLIAIAHQQELRREREMTSRGVEAQRRLGLSRLLR